MKRDYETGLFLILGNMFGGKTSELIRRLEKYKVAEIPLQVFRTSFDNRYGKQGLTSHNQMKIRADIVKDTKDLISKIKTSTRIIGIDELQFFSEELAEFCIENSSRYQIIATGLLTNYRGEPFSFRDSKNFEKDAKIKVTDLIAQAKETMILDSVCTFSTSEEGICGKNARYCQRLRTDGSPSRYNDQTIIVGGKESYYPRCSEHFIRPKPLKTIDPQ